MKRPYFRDAIKSKANSRSSSQSIFVEDPPTHHHPTHTDSDSLSLSVLRALSRKRGFFYIKKIFDREIIDLMEYTMTVA